MFSVGDVVSFYDANDDCYYMGVVMEIEEGTVFVSDINHEQHEIPEAQVRLAYDEDMLEELRCLYGFYK